MSTSPSLDDRSPASNARRWAAALVLVVLAIAVAAIYRASPGPRDQEIQGVAIGNPDDSLGVALISGRHLACSPSSPRYGDGGAVCRMTIAGRLLEIEALRNEAPNYDLLGGQCTATYNGQPHPCRFGNPNVNAFYFAYLPDGLGLVPFAVNGLRSRYPIENLPEAVWTAGWFVVPLGAAGVVGVLTAAWFARRWRRRLVGALVGTVAAMAAFALSSAGWLMLTGGLWD